MNDLSADNATRRKVVLVTGMSGAGRTTALKGLEDLGYEAVDNLPLSLLANLLRSSTEEPGGDADRPLAIGVDLRTRNFATDPFISDLDRLLADTEFEVHTLFLDCENAVLLGRFSETRRRHPLDSGRPVPEMIQLERDMLGPVRERADMLINTTDLSPWQMRELIGHHFAPRLKAGLSIYVTSFAYPRGTPPEADLVFDVRFLVNPHYNPVLRPLTGEDEQVQRAIRADPDFEAFFDNLWRMLEILLPRYEKEGKSYLTIAIGCTGGRHRSVFVAQKLADAMEAEGWGVRLRHRELQSPGGDTAPEGDTN